MIPVIKQPTRISNDTFSIIDNIFVNDFSFSSVGIIPYDSSDHYPIFLIQNSFFSKQDSLKKISFRINSPGNLENLYRDFSSIDFNYLLDLDCETATRELHSKLLEYYDKHCPIKTKNISKKDQMKPWICGELKILIKRRQKLYVLKRLGKVSAQEYSNYRNFVTSSLRVAKKNYFSNLFEKVKCDSKKIWHEINKIINPHKSSPNVNFIKSLIINNKLLENPVEIADDFNEYFCDIGKSISNSFNNSPVSSTEVLNSPMNSFFFRKPTTTDVSKAISSLKNKSCHISMYPVRILKCLQPIISPILALIIEKSYQEASFPNFLKIARVVPLHKADSKSNVSNFRPISILTPFSKIFEKIVFKQMIIFLTKFKLLNENQYGFRPSRSTTQAILDNLNFVYNSLDSDNIVISLFLDFSKTFDVVDPNLLLFKLGKYGFTGKTANDWFRLYLTGR